MRNDRRDDLNKRILVIDTRNQINNIDCNTNDCIIIPSLYNLETQTSSIRKYQRQDDLGCIVY